MVSARQIIKRSAFALFFIAIGFVFYFYDSDEKVAPYQSNTGNIFGTYYKITYQSNTDLHEAILARLQAFDASLSMFNDSSIISRINRNEEVTTDADFEAMFTLAEEVSGLSGGAFDITVASLVNAWGFGFKNKENVTPAMIDSLLQAVGFANVMLSEHHVYKSNPNVMLDAGAIAKGQGCDVVANLLRDNGCENFLVDIGGEVVCQGYNNKGDKWKVGIVIPTDDPTGQTNELQEVIASSNLCMATSGNYRQFYYDNGVRRSHTIDPRTGYPVNHNLLSATVIAPSCMEADAFATACMVLGATDALALINTLDSVECYLICGVDTTYTVWQSNGFGQYLQ